MNTEGTLQNFLNTIDQTDRQVGDRSKLSSQLRKRLLVEMEMSLANTTCLKRYMTALQAALQREDRYTETLEEERLKAVLGSGLSVLKDGELVRLSLNPIGLSILHVFIFDAVTDYWVDRMCEMHNFEFSEQENA